MPARPRLKLSRGCPSGTFRTGPPPTRLHLSSAAAASTSTTGQSLPPAPPQRWVSDLQARVGRCLAFGCSADQVSRAARVLAVLAAEWRHLLAGSEGFLTRGGGRAGDSRRVVWGEMDSFGHVNNVNYFRYAESARVDWITDFSVRAAPEHREAWAELMKPRATGLIMRSLKSEFKFPLVYPDTISVYHKLRPPSGPGPADPTAITLDCVVLSHRHRRPAARLEEDVVVYDYRIAARAPLPDFAAAAFAETMRAQEAEAAAARRAVWGLIGEVEALERGTWDREGAVEDLGGGVKGG